MCAIITSCTLLPCNFTLVDLSAVLQFEHSTGVATMSSVAQLQVRHSQEQRQSGNARSKKVTHDAYRPAN